MSIKIQFASPLLTLKDICTLKNVIHTIAQKKKAKTHNFSQVLNIKPREKTKKSTFRLNTFPGNILKHLHIYTQLQTYWLDFITYFKTSSYLSYKINFPSKNGAYSYCLFCCLVLTNYRSETADFLLSKYVRFFFIHIPTRKIRYKRNWSSL